jgi:hypothetical protein
MLESKWKFSTNNGFGLPLKLENPKVVVKVEPSCGYEQLNNVLHQTFWPAVYILQKPSRERGSMESGSASQWNTISLREKEW